MPLVVLDRLPLPSLRVYTCVSVAVFVGCVYLAAQNVQNPSVAAGVSSSLDSYNFILAFAKFGYEHAPATLNGTNTADDVGSTRNDVIADGGVVQRSLPPNGDSVHHNQRDTGESPPPLPFVDMSEMTVGRWVSTIFAILIREPIYIWSMINMTFCCLILMGRGIQKLVFGELRVSEHQKLKDKFWNFIFYKFIFIFGIVNVQFVDEVMMWCSWFAVLGFLQLLSQLGNDRFEYLSFSPTTPIWSHIKLLALLSSIFALSGVMLIVAVFVGFYTGLNTFAFMSAEVILLGIRTLHVIFRYALHLYDLGTETEGLRHGDDLSPHTLVAQNNFSTGRGWHQRGGPFSYYIEIIFELTALCIDFVHHMHMLIWSNILLSMASLVVCMQLRYLMNEIQHKVKKHRNYLWVRNYLERNYPMASQTEIAENSDNCAICWEKIETARKLPCGHLFHNTCLQSWIEQDTTCPTCRLVLNVYGSVPQSGTSGTTADSDSSDSDAGPTGIVGNVGNTLMRPRPLQHFFHFDGSRYVSWLPSFSVEVSHAGAGTVPDVATSQLEEMARQVQQLFPNLPFSLIISDLRVSHSVELTIENVLDGRLVVPPVFRDQPSATSGVGGISSPGRSSSQNSRYHSNDAGMGKSQDNFSSSEETDRDLNISDHSFSQSPTERERILHKRKEMLIKIARKRYLDKQRTEKEHSS